MVLTVVIAGGAGGSRRALHDQPRSRSSLRVFDGVADVVDGRDEVAEVGRMCAGASTLVVTWHTLCQPFLLGLGKRHQLWAVSLCSKVLVSLFSIDRKVVSIPVQVSPPMGSPLSSHTRISLPCSAHAQKSGGGQQRQFEP